ncbi:low temperature requirement protein A [Bacillus thuringiensis]|uniref:low temperature requirement protein A n=1 Tax=Bacillus thuringiensis TaxID=1428 RepID=UPI003CFF4FF0
MHTIKNNPLQDGSVNTMELFFDLVFVFTITQLTNVFSHHLHVGGFFNIALMLALIWWMYGGYLWLTNITQIAASQRRVLLLAGMAGFLIISLSIPKAFDVNGWAFGMGYLLVNTVHSCLFILSSTGKVRQAALSMFPLNLLSALLVFIGGFVGGFSQYVLWCGALLIQTLSPYVRKQRGEYYFLPHHFVERHGLVVIIVIGESIIAIGIGAAGHTLDMVTILSAILGLILSFSLWSLYFSEEKRVEHAFLQIPTATQRRRIAFNAFGYAHYVILLGIIVLAVGIKKTLHDPLEPLTFFQSFVFANGVSLYILGNIWFQRILSLNKHLEHILGILATNISIFIGMKYAILQLCILSFLIYTILFINKKVNL